MLSGIVWCYHCSRRNSLILPQFYQELPDVLKHFSVNVQIFWREIYLIKRNDCRFTDHIKTNKSANKPINKQNENETQNAGMNLYIYEPFSFKLSRWQIQLTRISVLVWPCSSIKAKESWAKQTSTRTNKQTKKPKTSKQRNKQTSNRARIAWTSYWPALVEFLARRWS